MPQCRSCPAPILFAWQQRRDGARPNPLNANPHPQGNLRLDRATMQYEVLSGETLAAARSAGEELYVSHFAVCPARTLYREMKTAARASSGRRVR